MANREVRGTPASSLFLKQVESNRVSEYVQYLNQAVPYEIFMFDVQVDLSVQSNAEQIAEVMYRVLLRNLDYAEDYDISELEIELEGEKNLVRFQDLCQQIYKDDWRKIRKGEPEVRTRQRAATPTRSRHLRFHGDLAGNRQAPSIEAADGEGSRRALV